MHEQEEQERATSAPLPAVMALSYLGDAVYSLYVRRRLVALGISHAGELNSLSLVFVTAEAQAKRAKRMLPLLLEWEESVRRRAYNHKGLRPPKHASVAVYRAATGFEAVLGALEYTKNYERLFYLLDTLHQGEFEALLQEKK
ncbi:MAG: Mini-ribonuclease 3 [Clostridia bacterium]|nr:Mini-ribonuclease 3 [Clostridia bacterium]